MTVGALNNGFSPNMVSNCRWVSRPWKTFGSYDG